LIGKPKGRRIFERSRARWEDNIKIDLREIQGGKLWTGFIWLRTGSSGSVVSVLLQVI
jgi:hypothetical protein